MEKRGKNREEIGKVLLRKSELFPSYTLIPTREAGSSLSSLLIPISSFFIVPKTITQISALLPPPPA
jgi:hypothetical protein